MKIQENTLKSLRQYCAQELANRFDERERQHVFDELCVCLFQLTRTEAILNPQRRFSESELLKFHFAIKALKQGEPLQYVTGVVNFYGLTLAVNYSVLIPRPETEELVKCVLEENKLTSPRILDIGTGSGCIAIALKKNIPFAEVWAVDVSEEALQTAGMNAKNNEADIQFLKMDILNDALPDLKFDIIVSNPPYVLESEKATMHPQVTSYEPHVALFVPDKNPLVFYERIAEIAATHLQAEGMICCEIHERMASDVLSLSDRFNLKCLIKKDIQGRDRIMIARR